MENINSKAAFLKNDFANKLRGLDINTKGLWGKMNVMQMIEHMSYALRQANGRDKYSIVTPEEHLPKMQAFLMSDKAFRENTPNVLLPDEPEPAKHSSAEDAITELQSEIDYFFELFEQTPGLIITNPFFGNLDYRMWVQLLHKHAWHHLKQFGITE